MNTLWSKQTDKDASGSRTEARIFLLTSSRLPLLTELCRRLSQFTAEAERALHTKVIFISFFSHKCLILYTSVILFSYSLTHTLLNKTLYPYLSFHTNVVMVLYIFYYLITCMSNPCPPFFLTALHAIFTNCTFPWNKFQIVIWRLIILNKNTWSRPPNKLFKPPKDTSLL